MAWGFDGFKKYFPLLSDKIVSYIFFHYCNNFTFHI